jgi:hypothetical protein
MSVEFNDWLITQRMHQETQHDVDHRELACDPYQMSRYVLTQMHSALDTMETARMNVPSHGMHEETQRKAWEDNRSSFVDNIVTMLGCVGSMLTAVGCTDKELARRYTDKLGMDVALRNLAAAAAQGPELVLVPGPEVSAIDLSEDEEDDLDPA